jgi:hypothetical protein
MGRAQPRNAVQSLRRAPGRYDLVTVAKKRLYLIARMTVASVADLHDHLREHPEDRTSWLVYHACANEALIGLHGSFLHFDLAVPDEVLQRWRFAGNRGERPIKGLADGMITIAMPFQGTYRLSERTANDLFHLLLDHEARSHLHVDGMVDLERTGYPLFAWQTEDERRRAEPGKEDPPG